jgi:hypothetical protein
MKSSEQNIHQRSASTSQTLQLSAHQTAIFNGIASIAARIVGSPATLIIARTGKHLRLLGVTGLYLQEIDESWSICKLIGADDHITFVNAVHKKKQFNAHPLLAAAPYTTSILYVPVSTARKSVYGALVFPNPAHKWPLAPHVSASLSDLAIVAGDTLNSIYDLTPE